MPLLHTLFHNEALIKYRNVEVKHFTKKKIFFGNKDLQQEQDENFFFFFFIRCNELCRRDTNSLHAG